MAHVGLSYPFRISHSNRRFSGVPSDSDTYKAEQIKGFLRTNKGEREMFPDFGIDDPTFAVFDAGKFSADFNEFYSDIRLTDIQITKTSGVVNNVLVEFE